MNLWQALQQIRYRLQNRAWTGSATLVFAADSVIVSQLSVDQVLAEAGHRLPAAIIRVGSGSIDPEHRQSPNLLTRQVAITLVMGVDGDHRGSDPLLGAHRVGTTESDGRGLLEIEEEVSAEIELLAPVSGFSVQYRLSTIPQPEVMDGDPSIVSSDYIFDAKVSRARRYHPVTQFVVADAGSGNASLSWTLPPDRFDRLSIILRRAAGSTAPATVADGTGITLSGDLATSHTDDPGAGTFSYSIFAAYDEVLHVGESGRAANRYSDAVSRTVAVT